MKSLTVVGRENDLLIVVNESGERFSIAIDQALADQVRRTAQSARPSRHQTSPKDIQAHIRRGLTTQQVADLTGEDVSYIERFEGPVVAEREYVVEQARNMPVGPPDAVTSQSSFGEMVGAKLGELDAHTVTWSAWREEGGWRVEVAFFEGDVEHRARWVFDQRKHTLTALNEDAAVLSQEEPIRGPLIPKLRAVPTSDTQEDAERFDSEVLGNMPLEHTGPLLEPVPYGRTPDSSSVDDDESPSNTSDLLEVLRRRRGEREPAPDHDHDHDSARNAHPSTGSIRLVNPDDDSDDQDTNPAGASVHSLHYLQDVDDDTTDEDPSPPVPPKPSGSKKNRPEMPSWDDIVFGTRSDDDPA